MGVAVLIYKGGAGMDGELDKVFTAQEMRDLKLIFNVYDPTNSECISLSDLRKVW